MKVVKFNNGMYAIKKLFKFVDLRNNKFSWWKSDAFFRDCITNDLNVIKNCLLTRKNFKIKEKINLKD